MKKTLIALAFACALPAAFAGGQGMGPDGAKLDRMAAALQLTDEQKARVKTLFDEHQVQRQAMREQMRARMAEVLTPEQLAKHDALREQHRGQWKERHGRHRDCDNKPAAN